MFPLFREPLNPRTRLTTALALSGLVLAMAWVGCDDEEADVAGLPERVDFNFHVKPILSDRCFACHGPDGGARKADLRLDREDGAHARLESGKRAVVPGSTRRSEMIRRISSTDPTYMMPPPESHLTLSEYEIALLTRWIDQGAEWKPHWAFIPPEKPDLPAVDDPSWARNEIDHFVASGLEERGLSPAGEAGPETLLRRVTLDLTGLPPTLEEIDAFLADAGPDAFERVVDRLLASEAYGERMAIEWLDVSRYADTHGFQDDGLRNVWPWREWVIEAFNDNMPFDEFVTLQLAGDLLPNPTQDQLLATTFNRHHMQSQEGGVVPEEYRSEYVADRVNTLGAAFLGVTLECARCHDHKYDPVLQKEYYQLAAFFNSINETGQIPYSGESSPIMTLIDEVSEDRVDSLRAAIRRLEAQADPRNAAFDDGFEAWLRQEEARVPGIRHASAVRSGAQPGQVDPIAPGLIAHLALDESDDTVFVNEANGGEPGVLGGDPDRRPEPADGRFGGAQRLVGDSFIEMGDDFAFFERTEPFSVSIWFFLEDQGIEGPLFSKSAGIFNGNRGYECMLNADGTIGVSLNHVFPDQSIALETLDSVSSGRWYHLVMTYDGSSKARGLRVFIDGRPARSRITADNLERSILHAGNGSNWGGDGKLRIGSRFEETIENVLVDEFRVYERRLTDFEVEALSGADAPLYAAVFTPGAERSSRQREALRDHYVRRVAPSFADVLGELTALRGEENDLVSSLPAIMISRDRLEPRPTFVLERGAYDAPTEEVGHGTPEALMAFPDSLSDNRLGLARWLLSPENPLTARVLVNRYWQMFFGRGIVPTPEDFGSQGRLPTHPQLLDWLATTFVESGWDLKALHRLIVTSATYRQSSLASAEMMESDPENEWLGRGPSHRLPAEMIRDNALAASGLLVREIGGPSVFPYQPEGIWEELATRNATTYVQDHGDKLYRRSLYTFWKRSSPPPSMMSFDAAERAVCTVKRQRTNTPLQSLILMNDPQYVEASRVLAERVQKEGGAGIEDQISTAFRLVVTRRPQASELATLVRLYEEELETFRADSRAALDLLRAGEYPRDARLDPAHTAALTVVASTIMNFDEAVMKR